MVELRTGSVPGNAASNGETQVFGRFLVRGTVVSEEHI